MAKKLALPTKLTPKAIARAYMEGTLDPADYPTAGGVARWIRLAESGKSEIAAHQALTALAKLADLERPDRDATIELNIIPIAIANGNIVKLNAG